jgi:hypothetical protein
MGVLHSEADPSVPGGVQGGGDSSSSEGTRGEGRGAALGEFPLLVYTNEITNEMESTPAVW